MSVQRVERGQGVGQEPRGALTANQRWLLDRILGFELFIAGEPMNEHRVRLGLPLITSDELAREIEERGIASVVDRVTSAKPPEQKASGVATPVFPKKEPGEKNYAFFDAF